MTAGLTIFFVVFNQMKSNEKGANHKQTREKSRKGQNRWVVVLALVVRLSVFFSACVSGLRLLLLTTTKDTVSLLRPSTSDPFHIWLHSMSQTFIQTPDFLTLRTVSFPIVGAFGDRSLGQIVFFVPFVSDTISSQRAVSGSALVDFHIFCSLNDNETRKCSVTCQS